MKVKKLVLLILLVFFFSNLSAALISHLEFEDNFEDSFGDYNGVNGPIIDDTTKHDVSFSAGKEGKAIYFDGNDYIEIGKNYLFDPRGADNSYSISMWVYSTEAASSSNANCYIGKHTDSGGNVFLLGYWSSTLRLQIRNTYVTVSTSAEIQEWTHYVVTAEESGTSTNAKVYKNGIQIWSGTLNDVLGTFSYDDKSWVLGQDWDSSTSKTDWFKGYMDNVRFYDSELDSNYVKEIYLKESSMVHLALDDNYEDSAGNYNGSQTGGVAFVKGMENRAASLDGSSDYIEFGTETTDPRATVVVSGNTFKHYSASLWVKSHLSATTSDNNCYIGKHDDSNGNLFLLGYWNATLRLQIGTEYVTVSTQTEPTVWTHYAVTAAEDSSSNSTVVVVYRNGENIWSGTIAATMGGTFQSNYRKWVLGQDWDGSGPSDYFYGYIDNVRLYKKYLSAVEVQQLYRSEFSGLRYCNVGQDSACTVTKDTDYDLSDAWWWVQIGFGGFLVTTTDIESIKVSEGWEAYLCTSTNNQGTCHYFDDGVYDSGNGLPSELINDTYSITVQPKTFDYAKKYFGYKRVDESGSLPVGFAYFYQYANYAKPSKENDRRRLFMDSEYRRDFQNMSVTILGANRASGAELFGNVYAILSDNSQNDKYLMTSHRNFAFDASPYGDIDFRNYDDDVKQIWLVGRNQEVGSVGWFIANDVNDPGERDYVCLKGVNETINDNEMRIECNRYYYNDVAFESGVGADEFFERVHSGNHQKFEKYADNYNLLMLTGHGSFYMDDDETLAKIYIPYSDDAYRVYFTTKDDLRFNYSSNLGQQNTRWVEATACQSMGVNDVDWDDVGDAYYNVLTRLNGIGGYRNNSSWGYPLNDTYNYYEHWDDLAKSAKTVSKAWVDSWSEDFIGDPDRDARFLTLENCNCTQTASCNSYMLNDYFFNVQTGPMNQKTTTTGYDFYCFRDRGDLNIDNYVRTLIKSIPEETYPEEFSSYSIEPVADSIIEEMMGIEIGGKETRAKGENDYSYRDDYLIIKKSGKNFSAIMNRTQESFRYDNDWEYEAKDKFEEAKAIAETLTTLDLEYAGISKDTNEAFEIGGNGESLGKSVNSISFVFRPKIDGIPVFIEDISVEYDAEGIYQIRSRVPYSIIVERKGTVKTKSEAVAEMSEMVKIEEAERGNVIYTLDENNELSLFYMTRNEEKGEIKTISLEAKNE